MRTIIDCDPGHDDAVAILLAASGLDIAPQHDACAVLPYLAPSLATYAEFRRVDLRRCSVACHRRLRIAAR